MDNVEELKEKLRKLEKFTLQNIMDIEDMYEELKGWHNVKAYILKRTSINIQHLTKFMEENVRDSGVIDNGFRR